MNHSMLAGGDRFIGRLGEIRVPFLVIHGRFDPNLSHAHGAALADTVANARMVTLDDAGHELNERDWDRIVSEIEAHIR